MIRKWLKKFCQRFTPDDAHCHPVDAERTEMDGAEVGEAVSSFIAEHAENGGRMPLDGTYYTVSREDMDSIIECDHTNLHVYEKETYDCENFALTFMQHVQRHYGINSVGMVIDWSGGHAYNVFVYEDGSVQLFEPQGDGMVEPGQDDLHAFENVRIII